MFQLGIIAQVQDVFESHSLWLLLHYQILLIGTGNILRGAMLRVNSGMVRTVGELKFLIVGAYIRVVESG